MDRCIWHDEVSHEQ